MRAIVTADLHFSLYGQDPVMENGLHETLYYLNNVMRNSILKYALDNNIENCIVAGDVFHNKSIIHAKAMATFIDIVNDFPSIKFYLIDGNHDHAKLSGDDVTSLKALEHIPNVNVIHDAITLDNIYMVPWNCNLIENIKNYPKDKNIDYLISHFGLNEGQLNSGISIISEVGMKSLSEYKYVILGHYHKPQFIENDNTKLYYVGSPIQLNMGERNEEKRFLDIDFDNHIIKSINTEGYKKYFKITLESTNDEILKEIDTLTNDGHDVILEVTKQNVDLTDIPSNVRIINKIDVDITNRGISLDMTESQRLEAYLKIKEIPEDDIKQYIDIATEVIFSVGSEN